MKILIATDFSECSLAALNTALERSWPDNTEFRIVYAAEPVYPSCAISGGYVQPMIDAHLEHVKTTSKMLDKTVRETKSILPAGTIIAGEVLQGSPADIIIDKARDWDADLLVLGSHGRSGFERFLMGSVAEKVVSHAPCSVLVIKRKPQKDHKGQIEKNTQIAVAK